jgi:hypothetical protein
VGKLPPLLFIDIIYVRKLGNIIKFSKLSQFADSSITKLIYDICDAESLQFDLNAVQIWSKNKNLKLNASKSIDLRFALRKFVDIPQYKINDKIIPMKQSHNTCHNR